jgi:cell division protein FtsB
MLDHFNKIPAVFKNKYLLALIAFVVWMIFFDRNDLPMQLKRVGELHQLENSEENMASQIKDTKKELDLLKTSPVTLEKYAREKFMMKRDNEDLFIVRKNSKN